MNTRLIERYAIKATVPYMLLAGLLLTGLLIAQQGTRFAEVLEGANAPLGVAVKLVWILLPGILILTIPVAVLIGILVGFGRMNANSELVILRATGVSATKLITTMLGVAVVATGCSLYAGLFAAPQAARGLRALVLQVLQQRFESPLTPGTFETSVPGKILHVGDSDRERGEWKKVFIREQSGSQPIRLITADTGRIDASGDIAELVLNDAQVVMLPSKGSTGKEIANEEIKDMGHGKGGSAEDEIIVERLAQLRVKLDIGLSGLRKTVETHQAQIEELSVQDLYERGRNPVSTQAKLEARIALNRRLALCLAPLCFALLGSAIGVNQTRGGRGYGALIALAITFLYYLLTVGGEQLARSNLLAPEISMWLATCCVIALTGLRLATSRSTSFLTFKLLQRAKQSGKQNSASQDQDNDPSVLSLRHYFRLSRLLDSRILKLLGGNFCFCLLSLIALFVVFTLFDVWRFVAGREASYRTVILYFWYLQPFLLTALAPAAVFVATLIGYGRLTQSNEVVAWLAAGQSTYRLTLPGILFAALIGGGLWWTQENVLARSNMRQDELRDGMKSGAAARAAATTQGKQWVADNSMRRLFAYQAGENNISDAVIYDFDPNGIHLTRIAAATSGTWANNEGELNLAGCRAYSINAQGAMPSICAESSIPVAAAMFKQVLLKQAHLSTSQLRAIIKRPLPSNPKAETRRTLELAYFRRFTKVFESLVLVIIAVALALACGRYGSLIALSIALIVGTLFFIALEAFALLGNYGLLPAAAAAWMPLILCATSGVYFLSRQKT